MKAFNLAIFVWVVAIGLVWTPPAKAVGLSQAGQTHVVQPGETLSAIAAHYGVTLRALIQANGIANPNQIRAGRSLVIPGLEGGFSSSAQGIPPTTAPGGYLSTPLPPTACTNPYMVRPGDTISLITRRCGVTIADLRRWNRLTSNVVWIGQVLSMRAPVQPPATPVIIIRRSEPPRQPPTPTPEMMGPSTSSFAFDTFPTPVIIVVPTPTPLIVKTVAP